MLPRNLNFLPPTPPPSDISGRRDIRAAPEVVVHFRGPVYVFVQPGDYCINKRLGENPPTTVAAAAGPGMTRAAFMAQQARRLVTQPLPTWGPGTL